MATLYSQADANVRKTWFLMTTFFIAVIGIGWALSYAFDNPGILYIAVFLSIAMNVGSYWYSDKLALASTGAKPVTKEVAPDVYNIVENLAIAEGMPMPKVYMIDDPAPNAFATGRDPKHGVVAVTTGLLRMMDRSELEGVLAHELSHIKNRDTLVMTVVVVLLGFVTLLSDFFLRSMMVNGAGDRDNRLGAVMVVAGLVLAILSPIIAQLIQLAISRKREFLADASGALMTRYPEGLASALQKIGAYSAPMRTANDATAHLFISSPFGAKSFKGLHKLFMTHPPVEERVKALLGS
ncbi:M48 family metallopeptidase [Patescibacteria group bacterium]|nr:M48 family metallopeptidase [Patescibacteria group bacterium]